MINIIAAMTKKGVIGKENKLPWNISDELKHFKRLTQGSTVIMGLRTFESIGRPLPNRHNIVLSPPGIDIPDVDVCHSVSQALSVAHAYGKDIFIIGGAYTYAQFLSVADRLFISYIKKEYEGDVYFPAIDWEQWQMTECVDHAEFESVVYLRHSSL